ncbi:gibberellin 3-beta-dioxygenase 1 [Ricinus communis]|uniref:gibberellin 3beta-dioxygenase n=1 Tax=Ricinus communis TaxID=3988 RepID=B9RPD0_RICCO|nr:gibberellin 3-beta-dioxygenase 1 [Ricinus communis]EEF47048.1 gibberellin 3-beta hydroxylase, putative [Ricinus communis]|eukprot:XP_002515599.1 gibberellin 3-beta-dioxygenase 1 [Ricinus communis]
MATLAEACKDYSLHLHQIIPLDFDSIRTLPESHVWPESGEFEFNDGQLSIPTIDLNDPDAGNLIGHACETWGVFQVIHHNIPLNLLHEVESETRRLFSLPARQKLKALRSAGGAVGYGRARISHFFNKHMWHEGFTIMGSPVDHARQLWPHDYQRFCDVMEGYEKKMKELATTLMRVIFKYLGISEEQTKWVGSPGCSSAALQLNSYPYCPDPNRAMGLAPHTDTSFLTILHQSSTKGLQIFKEGVGWVLVYPTSGALVVNVGDFLHILSNARFPNVLHRVIMKECKQQRFSVAFFHCPSTDFSLFPLGLSSSCGEFPLYRSVSAAEYIGIKAKNIDNPLALIRI